MSSNRKVVAVIPARGGSLNPKYGSKRLPGKNVKNFCGKPLICWTIEEALKCDFIDEILVSTNDAKVVEIVIPYCRKDKRMKGILRPNKLAQDDTPMEDVFLHIIQNTQYPLETIFILLQPTSPLRTTYDISMAFEIYKERVSCPVISVYRENDLHFKLNGSIYIFSLGSLSFTKKIVSGEFMCIYVMPPEKSIDIDTATDFHRAELLMKKRLSENE